MTNQTGAICLNDSQSNRRSVAPVIDPANGVESVSSIRKLSAEQAAAQYGAAAAMERIVERRSS